MSSSRARKSSKTEQAHTSPVAPPRLPEVVLGSFEGLAEDGAPLIDYPGNATGRPLPALSTAPLAPSMAGRAVALLFADGDPMRPVLIGLVQQPAEQRAPSLGTPNGDRDVTLDGKRILFEAEREIVLKCGKASITLTRAGKVLLRGTYVLNRSSGVNRIKGGSVQIN